MIPTDPFEVKRVIGSFKSNTAPGWDKISTNLIKSNIDYLAVPICYLCNLSLETGIFPNVFKRAIVCPIYKSGDKCNPTNYRPISVLSVLSKILEKVVNIRLVSYLEKNKIINTNQFGFREGKSTEQAVLKLTTEITSHLDSGQRSIGVFLDLQKAFDTVSIHILLTRLESVGIRGLALEWFRSYLSNRIQRVRIGDLVSDMDTCTFGVPQGSTLGPTLFLIYINDLFNNVPHDMEIFMFADDTVLLFHGNTWPEVTAIAEQGLAKVTSWLEKSLLSLNINKTKFVCFHLSHLTCPNSNITLKIHTYPCNIKIQHNCSCKSLLRTSSLRYLGVIIDENLNWNSHIYAMTSRIRKLIYIFRNLRNVAEHSLLIQTYKALCGCLIRYCICVWGHASKTHMLVLERAQRALLKVLMYLPMRHPTVDVYSRAEVLSVRKTFIYEALRLYHSKTVPKLEIKFKRIELCPVPKVRTTFAQKHFFVVAPLIYNKLATDTLKTAVKKLSSRKFKHLLLKWLKKFDYYETENILKINSS